jgi:hypothetical protein
MKKLLLLAGLALSMTAAMSAAPLCTDFVGQPVTNANATGCMVGNLLLDQFAVIPNGGATPAINFGGAAFLLDGEVRFTLLGAVGPSDTLLQYRVTGANQSGASIKIGTADNVTITELICTNPLVGTTCVAPPAASFGLTVNQPVPPGQSTDSELFGTLYNVTYVQKDIAISANGSISEFINGHQSVPEPTTSLLMGTALLGLALLRKRFGQK